MPASASSAWLSARPQGRWIDRFGRLPVVAGALTLSILGIGGMLLASQTVLVLANVLVLAVSVRTYPPVMQAFAMERFPGDSLVGDFGALKTLYSGIGSLGPFYIGTVGEFLNYWLAYIGCVAALLVSLTVTAAFRGE